MIWQLQFAFGRISETFSRAWKVLTLVLTFCHPIFCRIFPIFRPVRFLKIHEHQLLLLLLVVPPFLVVLQFQDLQQSFQYLSLNWNLLFFLEVLVVYQSGQLIIQFSDWLIQEVDLERLFSNVLVEVE
jgi:hypothetical protein